MNPSMVTGSFSFEGYRIAKNIGIVRGLVVRSRGALGNMAAGFQMFFGGNITVYKELCEQARQDAYDQMREHAELMGANAIIGMRYDATEVAPGGHRSAGVWDCCCSGSSQVSKVPDRAR